MKYFLFLLLSAAALTLMMMDDASRDERAQRGAAYEAHEPDLEEFDVKPEPSRPLTVEPIAGAGQPLAPGEAVRARDVPTIPAKPKQAPTPLTGIFETKAEAVASPNAGKVDFRVTVTNVSDERRTLVFGSSQTLELVIVDEAAEAIVYRMSEHYSFLAVIQDRTVPAGESLTFEESWDMTNDDGERVPGGEYRASLRVAAKLESEQQVEPSELAAEATFRLPPG
ncbi:BsuPI-related putative proteinase inhibitor [Paenibacillus sp. TRM 82003]|nr:BsuPI-related putative proteinase inhibitor [Paenibacillus sp. TRM 82003]